MQTQNSDANAKFCEKPEQLIISRKSFQSSMSERVPAEVRNMIFFVSSPPPGFSRPERYFAISTFKTFSHAKVLKAHNFALNPNLHSYF